jgi:Prokaryotic N-terminal methylation motif
MISPHKASAMRTSIRVKPRGTEVIVTLALPGGCGSLDRVIRNDLNEGPVTPMRRCPEGGFTLIEVLVALVIAMLVVGVFTSGALEGIRAARESARVEEALVRARSRLAETSATPAVGDFQGDDGGGFHWHVNTRATDRYENPKSHTVTTLYAITVWISWRSGTRSRDVRLDAERLFTPLPEASER